MSYSLKVEDMLGPTDEARELQYKQYLASKVRSEVGHKVWRIARDNRTRNIDEAVASHPAVIAANDAYEATAQALMRLLGEDAHCNFVDRDLWSSFSDCYKEQSGFRPRFCQTREQVQDYFDRLHLRRAA